MEERRKSDAIQDTSQIARMWASTATAVTFLKWTNCLCQPWLSEMKESLRLREFRPGDRVSETSKVLMNQVLLAIYCYRSWVIFLSRPTYPRPQFRGGWGRTGSLLGRRFLSLWDEREWWQCTKWGQPGGLRVKRWSPNLHWTSQ